MSQGDAFVGRLVARVLFDGIEARDALDSLSGDGGPVAFEDKRSARRNYLRASFAVRFKYVRIKPT